MMNYLLAAYAVFWAVSFGLVFGILWRQRRLESELALIRAMVEEESISAERSD
jgi:hypothetical protein